MSNEKSEPDTTVEISGGEIDVNEEAGFYTAYSGFATNLRVWFIAYGIGAPVVLLSNDAAWAAIVKSGLGKQLAYLYFLGVIVQISAALMYKTAMWYLYIGELKKPFRTTRLYKISEFLSENYLIEALLDVLTIFLFGWASLLTIQLITNALL